MGLKITAVSILALSSCPDFSYFVLITLILQSVVPAQHPGAPQCYLLFYYSLRNIF